MTKKELIEALEPYADDTKIYICDGGTEMYVDRLRKEDIEYIEDENNIYINT